MSAELKSFAEELCWSGDQFRQKRQPIKFRLFSVGKLNGVRVDHQFESDFGLYYDPTDEYLLATLKHEVPMVAWENFVYHKYPDQSKITIIDGEADEIVAEIVVRRRLGGDPSGEIDLSNVTTADQFCRAREAKYGGK